MNRFLLIALLLTTVSCGNGKEDNEATQQLGWGKLEHFDDFLVKYDSPRTDPRKLKFDFNEAARDSVSAIRLQLVERYEVWNDAANRSDTKYRIPTEVKMYKDTVECPDNILTIGPADKEAEISFAFDKDASFHKGDHDYAFMLQIVDNGGLDRINNTDVSVAGGTSPVYLTHVWELRKDAVMNPLEKGVMWGGIGLAVFLLVWYVISRRVNPVNKFSRIHFDYHDGAGEQTRKGVGSCYKVVCTNRKQKKSIFYRFFVGNIFFEVNEMWTSPVTIRCGSRNRLRLSGAANYELDTDETIRKEPFTLTNEEGQKATVTTA